MSSSQQSPMANEEERGDCDKFEVEGAPVVAERGSPSTTLCLRQQRRQAQAISVTG